MFHNNCHRLIVIILFVLTIQFLSGIHTIASAAIYSYVDSNNVIHFTNVPTNNRYRLLFRTYGSYNHEQMSPSELQTNVYRIAKKYGVDPVLIMAMIKVESNFMPYAVSPAGAMGLMQILPSTARLMNVGDVYAPEENIEAGVRYFKYLYTLFKGDYIKAIAAYNAGEQAVIKYNGIPPYPETQWYVTKVLKVFWKMKGYTER
ncbi:MAG: transglycosylase SLT domain-containing protein [bacterium]